MVYSAPRAASAPGEPVMKKLIVFVAVGAALGFATFGAQTPSQQPPAPTADPYANNAVPGTSTFPLAASAGRDSSARTTAPSGAVNQGAFDPAKWKYGTRSEEHTSELQSQSNLVCRLLLEKKKIR